MFNISYMRMIRLKKADIRFQLSGCLLMLFCLPDIIPGTRAIALYIMAGVQLISCIVWAVITIHKPVSGERRLLQRLFILPALTLPVLPYVSNEVFFILSRFMLVTALVLIPVYFITTIREVSFYRKLVQRDFI